MKPLIPDFGADASKRHNRLKEADACGRDKGLLSRLCDVFGNSTPLNASAAFSLDVSQACKLDAGTSKALTYNNDPETEIPVD